MDRVLGAALAVLLWCGCPGPRPEERRAPFDVQGHRGARGLRPENTLPAFERALELGVSTLEMDLGVTRDRVVVVAHDPYVSPELCLCPDGSRVDGQRGPLLRDLSLAQLRRFDCGSLNPDPQRFPEPPWEPRPGTPVPTLTEVFALATGRGDDSVRFNLETKLRPGDLETLPAPDFVAAVLEVVRESGLERRISIQSFDWRALAITREREPSIETVALLAPETLQPEWLNGLRPDDHDDLLALLVAARPYVDVASPWWRMLVPADAERLLPVQPLQRAGYRVIPWTVNDAADMRDLIALGVDGLITDRPDRLLEILRVEGIEVR